MKQYLFLFLVISATVMTATINQFQHRAIQDISNRSFTHKDRAALLTDAQYRKEKRRNRETRHQEKATQRIKNYENKSSKLQSMHEHIVTHRTSADHTQIARKLHRDKAHTKATNKAILEQKTAYTDSQTTLIEQKINIHKAARNALRNAL